MEPVSNGIEQVDVIFVLFFRDNFNVTRCEIKPMRFKLDAFDALNMMVSLYFLVIQLLNIGMYI